MKTLYYQLRKSTHHLSDSGIKHMSVLLAVTGSIDSSTKYDNFISVKNRGGLWNVSAGGFEIFLFVEKFFRLRFQTRENKIYVQQTVSSLTMNLSTRAHFKTFQNFSGEESEDVVSQNLVDGILTLYLRAKTLKYVSL